MSIERQQYTNNNNSKRAAIELYFFQKKKKKRKSDAILNSRDYSFIHSQCYRIQSHTYRNFSLANIAMNMRLSTARQKCITMQLWWWRLSWWDGDAFARTNGLFVSSVQLGFFFLLKKSNSVSYLTQLQAADSLDCWLVVEMCWLFSRRRRWYCTHSTTTTTIFIWVDWYGDSSFYFPT